MSKTVLVAEDYTDIRLMTKFMLESFGYDVIEARDGYEAVEEAKEHHPDLILMDVAMPMMNGITAASLIRAALHCETIPIIAVTAYGKEYISKGVEYGFDHVMQKPLIMEDLRKLLKRYLGENTEH